MNKLRQIIKEEIYKELKSREIGSASLSGFKGKLRQGNFKNSFPIDESLKKLLDRFFYEISWEKIPFVIDNNDRNIMVFRGKGRYSKKSLDNHIFTYFIKDQLVKTDMDKSEFVSLLKKYGSGSKQY